MESWVAGKLDSSLSEYMLRPGLKDQTGHVCRRAETQTY